MNTQITNAATYTPAILVYKQHIKIIIKNNNSNEYLPSEKHRYPFAYKKQKWN